MKRFLFAWLIAGVALTGCSTDGSTDTLASDEDESPIIFDVTADDAQTRAEAMSNTNFAQNGRKFKLWAWMTDDSGTSYPVTSDHNKKPLSDITIICNNGTWSADETFYWPRPKYSAVDFYAVYPAEESPRETTHFDPDSKVFDFTGDNSVKGDADIMYATYTDRRTERGTAISKAAKLSFRHIMSQIEFKAAKSSELSVEIKSLEICNINSQGLFSFAKPSGTNVGEDWQGTWSDVKTMTNYKLSLVSEKISLTTDVQSLNSSDNTLMLIPQTREKWDTSKPISTNDSGDKGCYLKIGCTITMGTGSDTYDDGGFIYFPLKINWEIGKHYTYTLGFGTGYRASGEKSLTDIILSSEVKDWVDGGTEEAEGVYI